MVRKLVVQSNEKQSIKNIEIGLATFNINKISKQRIQRIKRDFEWNLSMPNWYIDQHFPNQNSWIQNFQFKTQVKCQYLTFKNLNIPSQNNTQRSQNILKFVSTPVYTSLLSLSLRSCNITNIQYLSFLNAQSILSLIIVSNNIVSIKPLIKLKLTRLIRLQADQNYIKNKAPLQRMLVNTHQKQYRYKNLMNLALTNQKSNVDKFMDDKFYIAKMNVSGFEQWTKQEYMLYFDQKYSKTSAYTKFVQMFNFKFDSKSRILEEQEDQQNANNLQNRLNLFQDDQPELENYFQK